ncbi:MAG: hypothetical protein GY870_12190 [archaeon]|nr:hypothetical protein [archaeon]
MKGIKKSIIWEIYCPACFKVYSSINFGKSCEVCGEIIKRRPLKNKR